MSWNEVTMLSQPRVTCATLWLDCLQLSGKRNSPELDKLFTHRFLEHKDLSSILALHGENHNISY